MLFQENSQKHRQTFVYKDDHNGIASERENQTVWMYNPGFEALKFILKMNAMQPWHFQTVLKKKPRSEQTAKWERRWKINLYEMTLCILWKDKIWHLEEK